MFYTVGQRTKWQRVLYVILPILSVALIILAYALVQQKMPLLLPDARAFGSVSFGPLPIRLRMSNLIGHIGASLRRRADRCCCLHGRSASALAF